MKNTRTKKIQGVASQAQWKYCLIVAIQSGILEILAFCYDLYLGTFMSLPLNIIQIVSIPIWRSLKKVSFLLLLVQYHNFSQFLLYLHIVQKYLYVFVFGSKHHSFYRNWKYEQPNCRNLQNKKSNFFCKLTFWALCDFPKNFKCSLYINDHYYDTNQFWISNVPL